MSGSNSQDLECGVPSPEVAAKARRRRFDAAYCERILEAADHCTDAGQNGALLRREGLYASQLSVWRRKRRAALEGRPRGRKAHTAAQAELAKLRAENQRLTQRLRQAEAIIEAQKKSPNCLG